MERVVIVGADGAGLAAGLEARRVDPRLEVVVYERGRHASSRAASSAPYWIGGLVADEDRLGARTPADLAEAGLEVHLRHEAVSLDPRRRRVRVRPLDGGRERAEAYDQLLLATGARAVRPAVAGADHEGLFVLRSLEDAERLHAAVRGARRAIVVGGGYVGVEMAENLARRGLEVHLVERQEQLLGNLDPPTAALALEALASHGVQVDLGTEATAFEGPGRVRTPQGVLEGDLVLVAAGVRPNSELARRAGVPCGVRGGIVTDARMATGVPGIWAAGDCCQSHHRVSDQAVWLPLGDTAVRMGQVAGRNLAGGEATFPGVAGTEVVRIFDRVFGRTGLSRKEAEAAGIELGSLHLDGPDRPEFMPGGGPVRVVLNWEVGTGRLVGGQVVGGPEAVGRVDALAVAILARWTLQDLAAADFAYAPPVSPLADPLQAAARTALGG